MKHCSKCGVDKPPTEFHLNRRTKDGLNGICKECAKAKTRAYVAANKEKVAASQKATRAKRPRVYHNKMLKWSYGITVEDYERMLENQCHRCACCHKEETEIHPHSGKVRRLNVDHDHNTGQIRGLLCNRCNRGIGLLGDTVEALQNAIRYLETEKARPEGRANPVREQSESD